MAVRTKDCEHLGHIWQISACRDETVSCARCYQHLSTRKMLDAYLTQTPKDRTWP